MKNAIYNADSSFHAFCKRTKRLEYDFGTPKVSCQKKMHRFTCLSLPCPAWQAKRAERTNGRVFAPLERRPASRVRDRITFLSLTASSLELPSFEEKKTGRDAKSIKRLAKGNKITDCNRPSKLGAARWPQTMKITDRNNSYGSDIQHWSGTFQDCSIEKDDWSLFPMTLRIYTIAFAGVRDLYLFCPAHQNPEQYVSSTRLRL